MEESFWEASAQGDATGFYARSMTADGFVVLPNRIVRRDDLVSGWLAKKPLRSYELSEPTLTLIEGGNVVITYEVAFDADWIPNYRAFVTVVYTWVANGWALVCRAYTPQGDFPF
jgi:hypothetical protein